MLYILNIKENDGSEFFRTERGQRRSCFSSIFIFVLALFSILLQERKAFVILVLVLGNAIFIGLGQRIGKFIWYIDTDTRVLLFTAYG